MALQPRHNRNYLENIANVLAQNPAIINGAAQIGRFAGNQIRQAYHNYNREYNEMREYEDEENDTKRFKEDNVESTMETNIQSSMTGTGSSGGPRGSLTGNTVSNNSYEKYYHEKQYGHSKKLKELSFNWGMSVYGPRNKYSGFQFDIKKWGTTALSVPGLVTLQTALVYGNNEVNAFHPFGKNQIHLDWSEWVYSNALNFFLQDFIDNKLMNDSGTKGFFLNYNKFRLLSFTVELTFCGRTESMLQYAPNVYHSARNYNGWQTTLSQAEKEIFKNYKHPWYEEPDLPGYFVYRDVFNSYANTSNNIETIPPSSNPNAADDKMKREQYVIKNLDRNLTYVKDREKFSFTREVKPQGNYYFDKAGLIDNLKTNIGNIVNQLEGQIVDGSNIVRKNPEGFNILFVPGRCKVEMFGEINLGGESASGAIGNGHLLIPVLTTQVLMKTTAKWEAFDYNYTGIEVGFTSDPLEKAIFDSNVERTIIQGQLNRGIY